MDALLKEVIDDYQEGVSRGLSLFKQQIGDMPPLVAWQKKKIPQQGKLSGEIEYQFHGIGCLLIFPEYEVDFDFGPDNRSDGFDLWRLTQYVSSRLGKYPKYEDEGRLKNDFEQAIEQGEVGKLDHPYCNLYFYI